MMQVDDRYEGLLDVGQGRSRSWGRSGDHDREDLHAELPPRRLADPRAAIAPPAATRPSARRCRWSRAAIADEVKKSNLRGLGGAGFPTGVKWGFIPKGSTAPKYLVDQRRRGRAGDVQGSLSPRARSPCPHRGHDHRGLRHRVASRLRLHPGRVRAAVADLQRRRRGGVRRRAPRARTSRASGFDFDIVIHRGAGAYICGEETGLLSSLEGKKGWPKIKPPFPAIKGAFGHPTIVNNVETIAAVPAHHQPRRRVVRRSRHQDPGGHPALFRLRPRGQARRRTRRRSSTTLRSLIYDHAGGIRDGRRLKAVVPGGSSAPILTADEIDVVMDVDGLKTAGTHGRLGGRHRVGRHRLDPGGAHGGGALLRPRVVRAVHAVPGVDRVDLQDGAPDRRGEGRGRRTWTPSSTSPSGARARTICAFYDGAVGPYVSYIEKFREEFESRSSGAGARMPKLTIDGVEIEVAAGHERPRGGEAGRGRGAPLLLSPRAQHRRAVPAVHGGRRQGAAAPDQPATCRWPTGWWCRHEDGAGASRRGAPSWSSTSINHPLDCPVCDQAGECWLQIYYMQPRALRSADGRREGAQAQGGAARAARHPRRGALHPLLALRPLLRRGHGHRRARHLPPRRSLRDRPLPGQDAREQVLRAT